MPASPARPSPGCPHSSPVEGVMAHEFASYSGAMGPEGKRRTVTYYGPIMGGLPISAWHCEACGLLRLNYPDGRREERMLRPGPQPGLLARPTTIDVAAETRGWQGRVSGLSMSRDLERVLGGETVLPARTPMLPEVGLVTWISIVGFIAVIVGLAVTAFLATYTYSTPDSVAGLATIIAVIFFGVVGLQIAVMAWHHFVPAHSLSESVAVATRGTPELDTASRTIVGFLVATAVLLATAAILATFGYQTSPLEGPVVIATAICFVISLATAIGSAASRHFSHPPQS